MQQTCGHCASRFFAEDEDFVSRIWTCSYCMPKLKWCLECERAYLGLEKGYLEGLCKPCKDQGSSYGFTNTWLLLRFKLFRQDHFACRYCGRSPLTDAKVILHADHVHPRSKQGTNFLSNLVTACADCNEGKIDVCLSESEELQIKNRRKHAELGQAPEATGLNKMGNCQTNRSQLANDSHVGKGNVQANYSTSNSA